MLQEGLQQIPYHAIIMQGILPVNLFSDIFIWRSFLWNLNNIKENQ